MTAATMLVLIATVVAVLAFTAAALIWIAHPVETPIASCGTLRSPANPMLLVRPAVAEGLNGDIEAALAPGHCAQAHAQTRYSQQLALASGGVAAATALGAVVVGRRERRQLEADARTLEARRSANGSRLAGHGLPNRPEPRLEGPGAEVWSRLHPADPTEAPGNDRPL